MEAKYLWLIFVWILGVALVTELKRLKTKVYNQGCITERYHPIMAFLMFLPIIYLAAIRSGIGDTEAYRAGYLGAVSDLRRLPEYMQTQEKDKGFALVTVVMKMLFGNRVNIYFMVIALICGTCVVSVYHKYSYNYLLSIFLFVASADYIQWFFNGMRQFIPVAILFACIGLILKKKYVMFIIITILLSTIHSTALLMIPMVFIAQGKAWNKKTICFIGAIIISIVFLNQFTNLITLFMENSQYSNEVNQFTNTSGTTALRVAVFSIPTLLAFYCRRQINKEDNEVINLCVNMSIASTGFYVVSMFTSGIFIGRIPIYFSLYNYILLPWEIKNLFVKKSSRVVIGLLVVFYLIFYYYQAVITWGI